MGRRRSKRAIPGVGLADGRSGMEKVGALGADWLMSRLKQPTFLSRLLGTAIDPKGCRPVVRADGRICLVQARRLVSGLRTDPARSLCGEEVYVVIREAEGSPPTCLACLAAV